MSKNYSVHSIDSVNIDGPPAYKICTEYFAALWKLKFESPKIITALKDRETIGEGGHKRLMSFLIISDI